MSHHLAIFDGNCSNSSGDKKYLTCHVILQNHLIEGSSNFMSQSSSWSTTNLLILVAIGIEVVDVFVLLRDPAGKHN